MSQQLPPPLLHFAGPQDHTSPSNSISVRLEKVVTNRLETHQLPGTPNSSSGNDPLRKSSAVLGTVPSITHLYPAFKCMGKLRPRVGPGYHPKTTAGDQLSQGKGQGVTLRDLSTTVSSSSLSIRGEEAWFCTTCNTSACHLPCLPLERINSKHVHGLDAIGSSLLPRWATATCLTASLLPSFLFPLRAPRTYRGSWLLMATALGAR